MAQALLFGFIAYCICIFIQGVYKEWSDPDSSTNYHIERKQRRAIETKHGYYFTSSPRTLALRKELAQFDLECKRKRNLI